MNRFIAETRDLLKERKQEVDRHLDFAKVLIDSKADRLAKTQDDRVKPIPKGIVNLI